MPGLRRQPRMVPDDTQGGQVAAAAVTAKEVASWARRAREATTQRDDAIRRMHADGATLRAIGEAAGLSHTAIKKILTRDERGKSALPTLPKGWAVRSETPRIEVTRGGGPPDWQADVVRQFIPGETTAWLVAPDGSEIPLPVPFTMEDIEQIIAHFSSRT